MSVILPVYNAATHVYAAVTSVLRQSFEDFELLIIDDGSTDDSLAVLRRLERQDARVSVHSRENQGLVATLNELIARAKGKYLARMDADDISLPRRFESQWRYLEDHVDCVARGSRCLFIDPQGLPICPVIEQFEHEDIDETLMDLRIAIVHPSVMLRTDAVRKVGGYRAEFEHAEDLDLFLRLAEAGRLSNSAEILFWYRVHESSISHRKTVAQASSALRAVQSACKRRGVQSSLHLTPRVERTPSPAELHRRWAWWALGAGNLRTARKHGLRALRLEPFRRSSLHLAACVVRDSLRSKP